MAAVIISSLTTDRLKLSRDIADIVDGVEGKDMAKSNETRVIRHHEREGDIYHHQKATVASSIKRLEEVRLLEEQKEKMVQYVGAVKAAFPTDAVIALNKAITEASSFGFMATEKVVEFMGMKIKKQQQTIQIETATGTVEARVGPVHIPGVGMMEIWSNAHVAGLHGEIEQDKIPEVEKIIQRAQGLADRESLYRGQSIKIRLPKDDDEYQKDPAKFFPRFIKPSGFSKDDLILDQMDGLNLETSLWALLERSDKMRARLGGTIKRGVLMAGGPGTGKTMVLAIAADIAPKHGWTYIAFDDSKDLPKVLEIAAKLAPALVACEDIDRADSAGQRNDTMNAILNSMDGAQNKKAEVITVLTTNHIEMLTEPLLRPGRFDEIIELGATGARVAEQLLQKYSSMKTVPQDIVLEVIGWTPAVIAEVGKKAKLYAEVADVKEPGEIHFQLAVKSMKQRYEILARKRPPQDELHAAISTVVRHLRKGMNEAGKVTTEKLTQVLTERL